LVVGGNDNFRTSRDREISISVGVTSTDLGSFLQDNLANPTYSIPCIFSTRNVLTFVTQPLLHTTKIQLFCADLGILQ